MSLVPAPLLPVPSRVLSGPDLDVGREPLGLDVAARDEDQVSCVGETFPLGTALLPDGAVGVPLELPSPVCIRFRTSSDFR